MSQNSKKYIYTSYLRNVIFKSVIINVVICKLIINKSYVILNVSVINKDINVNMCRKQSSTYSYNRFSYVKDNVIFKVKHQKTLFSVHKLEQHLYLCYHMSISPQTAHKQNKYFSLTISHKKSRAYFKSFLYILK